MLREGRGRGRVVHAEQLAAIGDEILDHLAIAGMKLCCVVPASDAASAGVRERSARVRASRRRMGARWL